MISSRVGVVRQPREIGAGRRREGCEGASMKLHRLVRRHDLFDRAARDLVPERNRVARRDEHARRQALVEAGRVPVDECLEQAELRAWGDDGDGVEDRLRSPCEGSRTRKHGVADRRGQLRAAGGDHLGDEERIATRLAVQRCRVGLACEQCDRVGGERSKAQADDASARGQLAEDDTQWMVPVERVVSVARRQQQR